MFMRKLGLVTFAFIIVPTALALPACGDDFASCKESRTCMPRGGTSNAGATSTAGEAGDAAGGTSGAGDAGAPAAGTSMNAGAGGTIQGGAAGEGGNMNAPCDSACSVPTPVCNETTDTCVECLAAADCTTGAKDKCDAASNTCVECVETTDCASPRAARCDGGTCVKCESNDDCDHISGKGICDGGACVKCTIADETPCGGKSCNPATNDCTTTTVGTVGTCKPCAADSECLGGNKADADSRCVPMEFNGNLRDGGFCLRREAKTCRKPFSTLITASSLSGAASEAYCGIDQNNIRCEAVLDLSNDAACSDGEDTSCGCERDQDGNCVGTGSGGLCRKVGAFTNRCTYGCGTAAECPGSLKCTVDDPYCH
jgi:hypothetical protein